MAFTDNKKNGVMEAVKIIQGICWGKFTHSSFGISKKICKPFILNIKIVNSTLKPRGLEHISLFIGEHINLVIVNQVANF